MALGPTVIVLEPSGEQTARSFQLADDSKKARPGTAELFGLMSSEGAAVAEEVDRFQQTGLTGSVGANDPSRARIKLQAGVFDASKVFDRDRGQHRRPPDTLWG